mgnify:CR=1 FL=1
MPIGRLAGLNERTNAVPVGRPSADAQPNSAANRSRPIRGLRPRQADDARHRPEGHGDSLFAFKQVADPRSSRNTPFDPDAAIESCTCDRLLAAGADRAPSLHQTRAVNHWSHRKSEQ